MTRMNDIQKIRLENFKGLLKEFKSKSKAAEKLGFRVSYISQILSGYRSIGEKTARKVERNSGRPHMWLDQEEGLSPKQQEVIGKIKNFPDEHLYALSAFVDSLSHSNQKN